MKYAYSSMFGENLSRVKPVVSRHYTGGRQEVHLLLLLSLMLLLAGCQSLRIDQISAQSGERWLTEGSSPQRSNAPRVTVKPPLELAWKYNAAAGFGPGSPLILGDYAVISTRKGEVHAVNVKTGDRKGVTRFGEAVEGTPVIGEGMLYVPIAWGRRALRAFSLPEGKSKWEAKHPPVEAGLLLMEDRLFAVDVESTARAYDASTGEIMWEQALSARASVQAAPLAVSGDEILVIDDAGRAAKLAVVDGSVLWQSDLGSPIYETPALHNGKVYAATTRGRFIAFGAQDGSIVWDFALPDTTVRFASPAIAEDMVIFGASDGKLRALDVQTGELEWTFDAVDVLASPPLITNETLYVASMGNNLYALDPATGEVLWQQEMEGRVKSGMAAGDGYLIVLAEPNMVYLFRHSNADYAATP